MKSAFFAVFSLAWLADMLWLASIGPLGRRVGAAMILYGCGFLLLIVIYRTFPGQVSTPRAICLILGLGLTARAAFLFFPPNSDMYRYIWEGVVQIHGFNPYLNPPADPQLAFLATGKLAGFQRLINHPHLAAIYPPATLLFFKLLAAINPSPLFFKAIFLLLDLGVMVVLTALIRLRRLPPQLLLFYAANPLAIVFISGEGHLDVLPTLMICLACYLVLRGRTAGGLLSLSLAVMSKYLAGVFIPFTHGRLKVLGVAALLLPLMFFLPFLDAGPGIFESLRIFTTQMHYNDFLTSLLRPVFGDWTLEAACLLLVIGFAWVWFTEDDRLRAAYLAAGCLLVVLPTLHPWYLVMIAPFLCFFPSRAWLYLQAAVLFTFPVLGHEFRTGVFQEMPWLMLPEFVPFYALLFWGLLRQGRLVDIPTYAEPSGISVIIPALNEADHIGACLQAIASQPFLQEVIVADGGSSDGTVAIAREHGARVVTAARGRGTQVRKAAEEARGDVLLILHADAILMPDVPRRILETLAADRGAAGGCCGMQFAGAAGRLRLVAALNNLKAAITGLSFGNQAQFVRAEALQAMGGFPPLMLMEDVELALRLKGAGGCVYLPRGVTVSARRWQTGSFLFHAWTVLHLFAGYVLARRLGRRQGADEACYRRYYGSKN